jgi:hypothetical protein
MGRRLGGGGGRGGGRGRGRGRDEEEDLPLHKAARSGDAAAVESLCESNPLAVNSRDRLSRTPYEPPSLQIPPFPPFFPLYLISREAPGSRALRYGSLASLISLLGVWIYNYMCAIGPWSLNPNRTSLRMAPAASFDGYNSALCYFCCCS